MPSPIPTPIVVVASSPESVGGGIGSADVVMFCVDSTNTYDRALLRSALSFAANGIESLVGRGQRPIVVYVSAITSNSYSSDNDLLTLRVPVIPTAPELPLFATPVNPMNVTEKKQVAAENTRVAGVYDQAVKEQQGNIERVKQAIAEQTSELRELNPPIDSGGSDNYGCVARAADRFQESSGQHTLILATDLLGIGPQQDRATVDLNDASVSVIFYPSKYATDNQLRMDLWRGYFQLNGAESVSFYDTSQSQIITLADLLQ